MEFRIAADELKKALHRAQGIVERKATMPILSNVLITAGKSGVTVTAFDLDIGIVSEHPAEVAKSGAITVSAKTLLDIVSLTPDANVTIKKLPNNYAELISGAAHYKIVGMAPEEFPKLPKEDASHLVKLTGSAILEMIKKTQYAISNDETQQMTLDALTQRLDSEYGVDVDEEMARLMELQNAFAANARVMSVVQELMDALMQL